MRLLNYLKKTIFRQKSFRFKLILAFSILSSLTFIIAQISSYYNISRKIYENMNNLSDANLLRTIKMTDKTLESYRDVLYQIYNDDDFLEMTEQINIGKDQALNNQLLTRRMQNLCYIKPEIEAITIITKSGCICCYDKLVPSAIESSWLGQAPYTQQYVYNQISKNSNLTMFSTELVLGTYNVFHMGHALLNYKNLSKEVGVVIVSIDAKAISSVINDESHENINAGINLIVDQNNIIVASPNKNDIGENFDTWKPIKTAISNKFVSIKTSETSPQYGWKIVNYTDQSYLINQIKNQQELTVIICLIGIFILILLVIFITNTLSMSILKVNEAMKKAETGQLDAQIKINKNFPIEIASIANQFNSMMLQINALVQRVKDVTKKQKDAEVRILEAQINPHFLYNTLDAINWTAIDHEDFEVSNMISALAKILRYSINKSNEIVSVKEEVDWLKQYLSLYQARSKNAFEYEIIAPDDVLEFKIHKLLFQPFVENSIVHGFKKNELENHILVLIKQDAKNLIIKVIDNGIGIEKEFRDKMNSANFTKDNDQTHIGMANAIGRINTYYGENAKVTVYGDKDYGTTIVIKIPKVL